MHITLWVKDKHTTQVSVTERDGSILVRSGLDGINSTIVLTRLEALQTASAILEVLMDSAEEESDTWQ